MLEAAKEITQVILKNLCKEERMILLASVIEAYCPYCGGEQPNGALSCSCEKGE